MPTVVGTDWPGIALVIGALGLFIVQVGTFWRAGRAVAVVVAVAETASAIDAKAGIIVEKAEVIHDLSNSNYDKLADANAKLETRLGDALDQIKALSDAAALERSEARGERMAIAEQQRPAAMPPLGSPSLPATEKE